MSDNFNTYIKHIDFNAWREICVSKGSLRHFAKGEEFVSIGKVGHHIGFIQSGTLKYVAVSPDGTEHVMGLVFGEGLVADWPFCLHGKEAKLAIVAVSDCEIYSIPAKAVKTLMDSDLHFRDVVIHSTEAVYTTVYDAMLTCISRLRSNAMMNFSAATLTCSPSFRSKTSLHF